MTPAESLPYVRTTIDFFLNGERVSLDGSQATRTVLTWLREERRLTGTKEGCAEGDCGACTVVLATRDGDYLPIASCIAFVGSLDGHEIITVEGLNDHPAQRAMVECHGSQCGFCTPGFVMALYAHYKRRDCAAADALAGNLCRCTGYAPILAAAERMLAIKDGEDEAARTARLEQLPRGSVRAPHFFAPRSVAELTAIDGATLLGGGTDVGLLVTKQHRDLENVIYLGQVVELRDIRDSPEALELGGAVTYTQAQDRLAALHPDIGELVRRLGGAQIRASGTIAGNIANGSPIGDSMPVLLALGSSLELQRDGRRRRVPLDDFYTGYRKTVLAPGEFIRSIRIPKLAAGERFSAYKLSKRFDQDISSVCAAFRDGRETRFAFGGMAATPARARKAEAAFRHGVDAACDALREDFAPLSDHRASAWYRLTAAQGLLRKFAAGVPARGIFDVA